MTLIVSLLVLFFSILSMSPQFLAHRIPIPKNDNIFSDIANLQLNANTKLGTKPAKATYQSRPKILYFNNLLSEHPLYGRWSTVNAIQKENSDDYGGFINLKYAADYQAFEETFDMILCFYNGIYTNTNYTCLTFSEFVPFITDSMFDQQAMTLTFNNVTIHKLEGVTNGINQLGSECVVDSTIYFVDAETGQPLKPTYDFKVDREKLAVRFRVKSEECGLDIVTSKMTKEDELYAKQGLPYTITMSAFAIIQCALCFWFNKYLDENKLFCQKISQGTVRVISAFDLYIAMESLLQFGNSFIIGAVSIPYCILAIYFETKTIRTINLVQGNLYERGLAKLHISNIFWVVVAVLTAVTSAFFQHPEWMFLAFSFHQIPQIFQNFISERKYRLKQSHIVLFVLPKIAYIFYVLGSPHNLFRYSPNITFLSIILNIILAQMILLAVQTKYPTLGLKGKSQYQFFEVPENGKEVCSICLEELDTPSPSKTNLDESLLSNSTLETVPSPALKESNDNKMTMVVTPCNHQFHECCLRDWAKLKSLCPYCRFTLPPLPEADDE